MFKVRILGEQYSLSVSKEFFLFVLLVATLSFLHSVMGIIIVIIYGFTTYFFFSFRRSDARCVLSHLFLFVHFSTICFN